MPEPASRPLATRPRLGLLAGLGLVALTALLPRGLLAAEPPPPQLPALRIGSQPALWEQVELLEDPTGLLTLGDLLAPPWSERFRAVPGTFSTPGSKQAAIWLRLRLENPGAEPVLAAVEPTGAAIEQFALFPVASATAEPIVRGLSTLRPGTAPPWLPPLHHVVLPLGPGEVRLVHVRIRSEFLLWTGIRGGNLDAFALAHAHRAVGTGFYFGIIAAMLVYNFALFLQVRRRMYLYYVLALLLLHLVAQMLLNGSFEQWIAFGQDCLSSKMLLVAATLLGMVFMLLFTRETLSTRERHPREDRLLRIAAWICLGLLPLVAAVPFGGFRPAVNLADTALVLSGVPVVLASVAVVRSGAPVEARYFLVAITVLIVGTLVHFTQLTGLVPSTMATNHALRISMVVESLLLSLALGERLRALSLEKTEVEQRERQNRKYRDFTRILAHDIANQTNVILNWAHVAARTRPREEREPDPCQRILHAARRQAEVLENVRELQRLDSGRDPVELASVALLEVLDEASRTFEDELTAKQLSFEIENQTPSADPVVLAEEVGLRENVVNNLVSNAIKFSPPGGTINARIRQEPGATIVEIIDRGAGIPVELRALLFSDEVLASRPGTSGERGTGIGMAIASRAAERFGARLGFETHLASERPEGSGTRFFVRIPDPRPQRPGGR